MSYATPATAASLANILGSEVTSTVVDLVDELINSWMNREYGFESVQTKSNEYHDIPTYGVKELMLRNWPVTEVTEIVDAAQSSTPTTLDSTNYVLDEDGDTGIIKLIVPTDTSVDWTAQFTRGVHSVKVSYKYGYSSVPSMISQLANVVAGKIAKVAVIEDAQPSGGIKRIQIGDFSQTFSEGNEVATPVQGMLNYTERILLQKAIEKYKVVI